MEPRKIKTAADAKALIAERNLTHVKVGAFDIDGILRGKYMSRAKFESALEGGFGFCDVVLGWDSKDQLYDNARYTGWHTGYPDANVRILPESCRSLPWEEPGVFFLGEFSGKAEQVCPRAALRRVLDRAKRMGYQAYAGFEYEFFVFKETPDSVREKGFRDLKPIAPDYFGYSVIRNSVWSEYYRSLLDLGEKMDFPIEGLHEETGPGVIEAAIGVDSALSAADKAALFKTFAKVHAQRQGLMATFMAKWSKDWPGQSGHIHISLKDAASGKPVFHADDKPFTMSDTMRWFVGGQQKLMPELLAMVSPTVNSYTRLIPGFWAPTDSAWSVDNRTCAARDPGWAEVAASGISSGGGRCESLCDSRGRTGLGTVGHREPDRAATRRRRQRLRLQVSGRAGATAHPLGRGAKAQGFRDGERVVRRGLRLPLRCLARVEEREFRRHITDWELARYFEII